MFGAMSESNRGIFTNLMFIGIFILMFCFFAYTSNKKKQQEDQIRKNLKIGDEVITIGGIVGKIISFRDENDSAVIESGSEKIRIKRWAISAQNLDNKEGVKK